jgi:hypothetical protein
MLIYGSATMGATVHLHYCMNELVGWSLLHDEEETCGKCGMAEEDKEGCCKDEHKHFKLKVDHQKTNVSHLVTFNDISVIIVPIANLDIYSSSNIAETYPTTHAPPGITRKQLHILYSVFLL